MATAVPAQSAQPVDFDRDIRPILSNHCYRCHGPDEAAREADLRLDTAQDATADRGGYRAIAPGDVEASAVLERIAEEDLDLRMPPADSGLELTADQIDLLRQWIRQGAEYELHWSFRPIRRPALPALPLLEAGAGIANAIDVFVLARLQAAGVAASPPADRYTLIRRVHLDLLGLPPTPEDVAQFVDDPAPEAYERLVTRVLASPHYGERWGRHWLDQARYADSNGYTIDSERSIWLYRDWVIAALNRDMPFDRFTIEQLAGDLLPEPTREQQIATGFHRNTLVNQEGGVDAEQFRNEAVVDRVNTTGAVWLGLTLGCAQCHSHKYDPISHREYYQLFAFFNSSRDVNSITPTIQVADEETFEKLAELDRQLAAVRRELADFERQQADRLAADEPDRKGPIVWRLLETTDFRSAAGATGQTLDDGSILVTGANGDRDEYQVRAIAAPGRITAVRLEAQTHAHLPQSGPGRAGNGNFVLNEIQLRVSGGPPLAWMHATADHSQKDYPITAAIDGDLATGWAINVAQGRMNVDRTAVLVLAEPLRVTAEDELSFRLEFGPRPPQYNLGRFRLAVTDASPSRLGLPDAQAARLQTAVKQLEDRRKRIAGSIPTTLVMQELESPRPTHVQIRGDFLRLGEAVEPQVPAVLPPLSVTGGRATRLDLARWLVDRENPLTARVTVNRIWMRYFGQGLVATEDDFGRQGSPPTHPELLDWLSAELIDSGWSLKHLHRLIVSSATYRQSSRAREDLAEIDPANKLLARQIRLRVEAEIVRDLALAASGLLDRRIGGPSVYPPQQDGVYAFTQRKAAWPTSSGADRHRRGLYTYFLRSVPYPLLTTFDAPDFSKTCTRRVRSNTPLQALAVANDQAMVELARALGRRLLAAPAAEDAARVEHGFLLCLSRPPTAFETLRLTNYARQQREQFAAAPGDAVQFAGLPLPDHADAAEAATWTAVARVLINLDEFITRE